MIRLPPPGVILGLGLLLTLAPARADIFHLKDGRRIRVEDWQETETQYVYGRYGGTVAIEKGMVVRIEPTAERKKPPAPVLVPRPAPTGDTFTAPPPIPAAAKPLPILSAVEPIDPDRQPQLQAELAQGDRARADGDHPAALRAYEAALRIDPAHLDAGLDRTLSFLSMKRYDEALSAAHQALIFHPDNPTLLFLTGEIYYHQNRLDQAIAAWERVWEKTDHPAVRGRIDKARRERQAEEGFEQIAGGRFRLRFEGSGGSTDLARAALEQMENQVDDLSARLDHYPAGPIAVILYPEENFHAATRTGHNVRGMFDGKIRIPTGGVSRLDEPFRRILEHEMAHALIDSKTGGRCPRWIHEGLAQYLSGDRAAPYRRTLADQFERRTGPDDWRPDLSYPHALSFVEYIIERNGFRTWWSILDALHRGLSPTDALWEALRRSPEQLAVEWGESLEPDRRRR